MFSRSRQLNLVIQVYIASIAITVVTAIFIGLFLKVASSWLIMVVGVTHLLLLLYFAWRVGDRPYVLTRAGNQVQSASYLHALIGFSSAIITLGQGNFSISALSFLLASALLTSLIGLWARGETESPNLEKDSNRLLMLQKTHARKLEEKYKKYADRLSEFYKGYNYPLSGYRLSLFNSSNFNWTSKKSWNVQSDSSVKFSEEKNNYVYD